MTQVLYLCEANLAFLAVQRESMLLKALEEGMGLYEFNRLPFGLSGAPGSFQRLMEHVLRGLDFSMVYIDDILVSSPDEETQDQVRKQFCVGLVDAAAFARSLSCSPTWRISLIQRFCLELHQVGVTGRSFSGFSCSVLDSRRISEVLHLILEQKHMVLARGYYSLKLYPVGAFH